MTPTPLEQAAELANAIRHAVPGATVEVYQDASDPGLYFVESSFGARACLEGLWHRDHAGTEGYRDEPPTGYGGVSSASEAVWRTARYLLQDIPDSRPAP